MDKSGIDFNRQFQQAPAKTPQGAHMGGLLLAAAVVAGLVFIGYKLLFQSAIYSGTNEATTLSNLENRLATIESRLDKLERSRRTVGPVEQSTDVKNASPRPNARTVYQIYPDGAVAPSGRAPNAATTERLLALQQGLGDLQKSQAANQDALQATSDRLADMVGEVGTQGVEILRSQDELNQLLSRIEMEAIPFELRRGPNPQRVGPVSLLLKSANPRTQRYTLCVYIQHSCVDLKNRTLLEVVQFVTSRNAAPLELIATKIVKHEILGYLEVPRGQSMH
jgi:hypothetical protein